MKLKQLTMIVLLLFTTSLYSQNDLPFEETQSQIENNQLPSDKTWDEIQSRPGLRAAPPDVEEGEKPNKVPLDGLNIFAILSLCVIGSSYTLYKKTKQNSI